MESLILELNLSIANIGVQHVVDLLPICLWYFVFYLLGIIDSSWLVLQELLQQFVEI